VKVPAAPTLLIVGSLDTPVIELNRWAYERIKATKELVVVAGASHLFEEPETRHEGQHHAMRWFLYHLAGDGGA
jgi:putative phosphoribosyl transferase